MSLWMRLVLAATAWVALCAATPLEHAGSIEVGAFGGYSLVSDTSELGNAFYPDNIPASGLLVGARVGYNLTNLLGAEGELRFAPSTYRRGGETANMLGWRAHALAHLGLMGQRLRPFVLAGAGGVSLLDGKDNSATDANDVAVSDTDFAWHLGVGAKFHVLDNLLLRLDGRYLNIAGREELVTSDFEVMLGVSYWISGAPADSDGDGVVDIEDKCVEQPEDKDGFEDSDGCPDPDNDNDGILDGADKCPNEAEDKDGFEDTDGCPDNDNDNDGIADANDKCRDAAEDKDGFQDDDGCPDPDNDNDGVADADDKCPVVPGVKELAGCPIQDKDKDGIPDDKDKCPDQAETFNGVDDEDGCPDKKSLVVVTETEVKILEQVNFETGKADIKPVSFGLLDTVALVLSKMPMITKVRIGGHTDDVGKDDANLVLSEARAAAVMRYMVDKGVAQSRLLSQGYGETMPQCTELAALMASPKLERKNKAKIAACREQNRRVQFKILEINGKSVEATDTIKIKEQKVVPQ